MLKQLVCVCLCLVAFIGCEPPDAVECPADMGEFSAYGGFLIPFGEYVSVRKNYIDNDNSYYAYAFHVKNKKACNKLFSEGYLECGEGYTKINDSGCGCGCVLDSDPNTVSRGEQIVAESDCGAFNDGQCPAGQFCHFETNFGVPGATQQQCTGASKGVISGWEEPAYLASSLSYNEPLDRDGSVTATNLGLWDNYERFPDAGKCVDIPTTQEQCFDIMGKNNTDVNISNPEYTFDAILALGSVCGCDGNVYTDVCDAYEHGTVPPSTSIGAIQYAVMLTEPHTYNQNMSYQQYLAILQDYYADSQLSTNECLADVDEFVTPVMLSLPIPQQSFDIDLPAEQMPILRSTN